MFLEMKHKVCLKKPYLKVCIGVGNQRGLSVKVTLVAQKFQTRMACPPLAVMSVANFQIVFDFRTQGSLGALSIMAKQKQFLQIYLFGLVQGESFTYIRILICMPSYYFYILDNYT